MNDIHPRSERLPPTSQMVTAASCVCSDVGRDDDRTRHLTPSGTIQTVSPLAMSRKRRLSRPSTWCLPLRFLHSSVAAS